MCPQNRLAFDKWIKSKMDVPKVSSIVSVLLEIIFDESYIWGISVTDNQTVYDYGFDTSYYGRGAVVRPWNRINLQPSNLANSVSSSLNLRPAITPSTPNLVLPTDEIIRMSFLLPPMIQSARPILLVGPQGSGKSTIVSHAVKLLANKGYPYILDFG